MSNTLTHDADALMFASVAADTKTAAQAAEQAPNDAPVGYRWVTKRWRVLPGGKRDYAAFHGKTAFSFLLPVSSRLHSKR